MTVPLAHMISGQSQGEDEELQDWMDGGLPHCCFTFSRVARSEFRDCEFTWRGTGMRMRRSRSRGRSGVLGKEKGSLDISVGSVWLLRLSSVLPGKGGKATVKYSNAVCGEIFGDLGFKSDWVGTGHWKWESVVKR